MLNKSFEAHRLAYELWIGPIPDGMFVCHHCDNRPCVNPDHLFLGTPADNMVDKVMKGRQSRQGPTIPLIGEHQARAKLTDSQVREIRKRYVSAEQLAAEYGVNKSIIYSVIHRRSWKHVE